MSFHVNCMPACSKVHVGLLQTHLLMHVDSSHVFTLLVSEFALRHAAKVESANSAGKYLLS